MTDRELLELAAKAAGYDIQHSISAVYPYPDLFRVNGERWNPLNDDGDALRLAVTLGLTTLWFDRTSGRPEVVVGSKEGSGLVVVEPMKNDQYAATRRAIVRAAAEIGKAMP
jgi:hypothetical protein